MAVPAITPQVDHHVALELFAELNRKLGHVNHGHGIVAVDVEDWRLDGLGHVGRIGGEACFARRGGEADLVVDDDVDRSAGAPPGQFRKAEGFEHNPLAGEGGVAVDQHRDHPRALCVVLIFLLAADDSLDDRIDQFEVAGIGAQADVDAAALAGGAIVGVAEVIFHIAVALALSVGCDGSGKFAEEHFIRLVQHVGEHIQPPAVGHAHADFLHTDLGPFVDQDVEQGDERLGAFHENRFVRGHLRCSHCSNSSEATS